MLSLGSMLKLCCSLQYSITTTSICCSVYSLSVLSSPHSSSHPLYIHANPSSTFFCFSCCTVLHIPSVCSFFRLKYICRISNAQAQANAKVPVFPSVLFSYIHSSVCLSSVMLLYFQVSWMQIVINTPGREERIERGEELPERMMEEEGVRSHSCHSQPQVPPFPLLLPCPPPPNYREGGG